MHPAVYDGIVTKLAEYGISNDKVAEMMYSQVISHNKLLKYAIEQSAEVEDAAK